MGKYRIVAEWSNGDIEELDIEAGSEDEAEALAGDQLADEYNPGAKITKIIFVG